MLCSERVGIALRRTSEWNGGGGRCLYGKEETLLKCDGQGGEKVSTGKKAEKGARSGCLGRQVR